MASPDFQPSRMRRRIAYIAAAVLVLLVLVVTPPLVNVSRYRRRIVTALSQSLNRPVHIDDVSLRLLPLPGLTFRNFVVSEDPAFGAEPAIRANTVVATLRLSSLWRRRVEFSTVSFTEPSLNLVRNAEGRWNLDSILMQAAHVPTAPTAQRRAGPAPRFPYIEATGARINFKLGDEKTPFSLTDADFALWLPEPDQWRVRLRGRPARTDTNTTDAGLLSLEGTLRRASGMAAVPVDLTATWNDAQLGETTRLVSGRDMGWRGTASGSAHLLGPLGGAALTAALHLRDLRRADFIPVRMLDVDVNCQSRIAVTTATLLQPVCLLPAPVPPSDPAAAPPLQPAGTSSGSKAGGVVGGRTEAPAGSGDSESRSVWPGDSAGVRAQAATFDLTSRSPAGLTLDVRASDGWLLDWARLFSSQLATGAAPVGSVRGQLAWTPADAQSPAFWRGDLSGWLRPPVSAGVTEARNGSVAFQITAGLDGFALTPLNLQPLERLPLTLSGAAAREGYRFRLSGSARPSEVVALAGSIWPPLLSGLGSVLPLPAAATGGASPQSAAPVLKLDFTCSRLWSAPPQTCVEAAAAVPAARSRTPRRHSRGRR